VAGRSFAALRQCGNDERGVALVMALMSIALLLTLSGAIVVLTATETTIAARFRDGLEAFHTAEAGIARALVDLRAADWEAVRAGSSKSTFADEAFDLAGPGQDVEAVAGGTRWQPYAYGRVSDMLPRAAGDRRLSVVVWVAADPLGDDKRIVVRSHAYAPRGVRRMVEVTLEQTPGGPRVIAWREGS
jgi:hypothetical protein